MKFEFGLRDNEAEKDLTSFTKVETESLKVRFIFGIIIGILIASLLSFLLDIIFFNNSLNIYLSGYMYLIIIILPLHEAIHLLFLPNPNKAIIGLSIKHAVFYIKYSEEISKLRFLLVSISPFIFLSIFPIFFLLYFKSKYIVSVILLNTLISGIDFYTFFLINKLPPKINLLMAGNNLYYRKNG
jgi:hypothetical protein